MTTKLHYLTSGNPSSPPVVFLHGFLGSGLDWQEIISVLSEDFYCVAVDLPGHGQTKKSSNLKDYSIEGAAKSLQAMLNERRMSQCALVGYSMGGRLALYLAVMAPKRWTRLVVESASPGIENPAAQAQRRQLDEKKALALEKGHLEEFLQSWYEQPLFESLKRDQARFDRLLERRRSNDPRELAKSLRGMSTGTQPSLWNELSKLDIPILVVAGEHDATYWQIGQAMGRLCSKACFTTVPDAGHNVHIENPTAYIERLRDFLKETSEVNHGKDPVERSRQVHRHQVP